MKWVIRGLLGMGWLMILAGVLSRFYDNRQTADWFATVHHVESFERRVSARELSGNQPVTLMLEIPSDERWKRVQKLADSLTLVILKDRDKGHPTDHRRPTDPLAPVKASLRVNDSSPVPLEVIWSNVRPQRWGLGYRVQAGDSAHVTLTPHATEKTEDGIVVTVDYDIETEKLPYDNYGVGEVLNTCMMWLGIILTAMGGLIVFLMRITRRARKETA